MPQTITRTPALAAPIVPDLTERSTYDAVADSRNQIHVIVGRSDVEATLRPAGLRSGTLTFYFLLRASAFAAQAAHRAVGIFQLTDTDVPDASMAYVVDSPGIRLTLAEDLKAWRLTVGFQEVQP